MSENKTPSGGQIGMMVIIGLVLMFGGMFLYVNNIGHLAEPVPFDLGKTVATIGVFLILFKVIHLFFIGPLEQAITDRNASLEKTFSEAEELKAEMARLRSDYEVRLQETERNARDRIEAEVKQAQVLRQSIMSEASEKADLLVAEAQNRIAQERDAIIVELRVHVVDLALAAAEKVVGENLDTERNRRLVEDFIRTAEVTR